MRLSGFSEISHRDPQHAEAFTVFFSKVLVVNLVRLSDGCEIGVFGVSEPIEAAVDKHVVDEEVAEAICCDAHSNPDAKVTGRTSGYDTPCAWHSENEEEGIVLFEEAGLVLVVVPMEIPHGPVHQILVGTPSDPFHDQERGDDDGCGSQDFHGSNKIPMKNKVCTTSNQPAARLVRNVMVCRHPQASANAMNHQAM